MQKTRIVATIIGAALGLGCIQAHAQMIANGSFETDGPSAGNSSTPGIGSTQITGWTVINNDGTTNDDGRNIIWIGNGAYGLYTPFGTDFLDLTGTTDNAPYAGVEQAVATVAGSAYSLTFDLGFNSALYGSDNGSISATVSDGATSQTFVDNGTTGTTAGSGSSATTWTDEGYNFVATSNMTNISIVGTTGGQFIGLDNVALNPVAVSAAPEPATWSLMLAGVGGIGLMLRRAKKAISFRFRDALAA